MEKKEWRSDEFRLILSREEFLAAKAGAYPVALVMERLAGRTPNTILVLYPSKPCISFGYFQDIDTDFDLELAKKHGIGLARRSEGIGGGHVFLDPTGGWGLQFVAGKDVFPTMADAFRTIGASLCVTYRKLGVKNAAYYPPDDTRASDSGRKLCAIGITEVAGLYVGQSSQMPGFLSEETLFRVAKIPEEKWKDKKFTSIEEYAGGYEAEMGRRMSPEELADALEEAFSEIGWKITRGSLTEGEEKLIEELTKKTLSDEHMFKYSSKRRFAEIPEGCKLGFGRYKTAKLVESRVLIDKDGKIKDMFFCGDFYVKPVPYLIELEESLKGVSVRDEEAILERVKQTYKKPDWETSMIEPEAFVKAVIDAGEKALGK